MGSMTGNQVKGIGKGQPLEGFERPRESLGILISIMGS